MDIQASFPAGVIGTTSENLAEAAGGENHEWQEMYPDFAKTARAEGLDAIAKVFEAIAVAEKQHAKRYEGLKKNIDQGSAFKKNAPIVWRCINCGYIAESDTAPGACPACAHPQAYFEPLFENW